MLDPADGAVIVLVILVVLAWLLAVEFSTHPEPHEIARGGWSEQGLPYAPPVGPERDELEDCACVDCAQGEAIDVDAFEADFG